MDRETRTYRMEARAQEVETTRRRILDVARRLFLEQPFGEVTLKAIADGADVTRQTVLNHFQSKGGVFLAAAGTIIGQRHGTTPGDTGQALDGLMAEYEQYGDALWRLLEVEERFPAVRTQLERGRRGHRAWVGATFGDRLPEDGPRRALGLHTLVAATDLYIWKLLRRDHGLGREATREVIGTLVAGALAQAQAATTPAVHGEREP